MLFLFHRFLFSGVKEHSVNTQDQESIHHSFLIQISHVIETSKSWGKLLRVKMILHIFSFAWSVNAFCPSRYSIRTSKNRYTEWVSFDAKTMRPNWTNTFGSELYDHDIDPDENLNLSDREYLRPLMVSLRERLHKRWNIWFSKLRSSMWYIVKRQSQVH